MQEQMVEEQGVAGAKMGLTMDPCAVRSATLGATVQSKSAPSVPVSTMWSSRWATMSSPGASSPQSESVSHTSSDRNVLTHEGAVLVPPHLSAPGELGGASIGMHASQCPFLRQQRAGRPPRYARRQLADPGLLERFDDVEERAW